jgi:hypothetical protein
LGCEVEAGFDQGVEGLDGADQVVGFAGGDGSFQAGFGCGALGGAGGEEGGPFAELGGDLGEEDPGVALDAAARAGANRTGPDGEDSSGDPEGCHVRARVLQQVVGGLAGLGQRSTSAGQVAACRTSGCRGYR